MAVWDGASGRRWTFAELAKAADAEGLGDLGVGRGYVTAVGRGVGFLIEVLRAWKARVPLCPLEPGQAPPLMPSPPAGMAHIKLTSGSTGVARVVLLTESQMAADADQIVATMGLVPEVVNIGVLSLAHSYGFSNLVTPLLLHGVPLVLAESPLPEAVMTAAARVSDVVIPAVPALWRAWHEAGRIPGNIRCAISAGAPLPLPLEYAVYERHGVRIRNFLGASECGGIAFDSGELPRTDAATVGHPMRGVELSVDAESGCLVVRSPAVAWGYWPESGVSLADGVFRTTDLARIDGDGWVRLEGRAADVINVAGLKVAPETVEQALMTHPAVADCVAFGIPDDGGRGEAVGVVYRLRSGVGWSELRAYLAGRLAPWQVPRREWHREDLGVDVRGKRSRGMWRDRVLGGDGKGAL